MNFLLVGTDNKTQQLITLTKQPFLLLDDGPVADAFASHFKTAKIFDPLQHSFNPLSGMDYKRARDFAATLYSASPQGENTLTVRNGKRALTKLLLANPTRLDKLKGDRTDPAIAEALATVDDMLLSPVLRKVLCTPTNFSFRGSVIARLDRAELGDFDAFVLGTLLIGQSKGQIVLPDFGFYGRMSYMSLMRQNRLTCSVSHLAELTPALRQAVLTIPDKQGSGCTHEDALVLAAYAGLTPGVGSHTEFVNNAMGA